MDADPQLIWIAAVTTAVGYLMLTAGVGKNALEWKRRRRTCPSCGRATGRHRCACSS
jgi:hypothetical protein